MDARLLSLQTAPTHYDALCVTPAASATDLRSAYLQRVLQTHPDKGGCEKEFQQVMVAYQVLSNAVARSAYNRSLEEVPYNSARRESQGMKRRREPRTETTAAYGDFLKQVWVVLQRMSPDARRIAITHNLSEVQRRSLEAYIKLNAPAKNRQCEDVVEADEGRSECCTSASSDEDGLSTVDQHTDTFLALPHTYADGTCDSVQRGIFRCVSKRRNGMQTVYYQAMICICCRAGSGLYLFVTARKRKADLARSVHDHIILIQVLNRIRSGDLNKPWVDRISSSIGSVLAEHNLTAGAGWRARGASTDEDPDCLYLRFQIHVNLNFRYNTSMKSPHIAHVRSACEALRSLHIIRGDASLHRLPYSEVKCMLAKLRTQLLAIRAGTEKTHCQIQHDAEAQEEHSHHTDDNAYTLFRKKLQAQEIEYLKHHEMSACRQLTRLLQTQVVNEERRKRQEAFAVMREASATKKADYKRYREMMRWNPHETFEESQRRITRLKTDTSSVA